LKGFLFDENLPRRVAFTPAWPVFHASEVGAAASDTALWWHARGRELAIVSKDADFSHRIMTATPPPWVVHLRFGNLRRQEFHALLARLWPAIEKLLPEHKLVNVYADRIEAIKG
jgi:predicted nuclease of predicted toxin-antitoxin system